MKLNIKKYIVLLATLVLLGGCSYSFTGASVPPHLKSIAIPYFVDRSNSGEPDLSDNFTTGLTQMFLDDNTLAVADKAQADAIVECTIMPFRDTPSSISEGESVSSRRITLTVKVLYKDLVKKKKIFEKNFSNYAEYSTDSDPSGNRSLAILEAIDLINEDILLGVVANW